jgi:hypothetical protein
MRKINKKEKKREKEKKIENKENTKTLEKVARNNYSDKHQKTTRSKKLKSVQMHAKSEKWI